MKVTNPDKQDNSGIDTFNDSNKKIGFGGMGPI
jgi:hypothetical protein